MRAVEVILTLIMGLFYYLAVAPVITVWTLAIQVFNGESKVISFVAIWTWPILFLKDPKQWGEKIYNMRTE